MKSRESLIYDMVRREVKQRYPGANKFRQGYEINRLLVKKFGLRETTRIIDKVYKETFGNEEE